MSVFDRIRQLHDAATPGPWQANASGETPREPPCVDGFKDGFVLPLFVGDECGLPADAAFIAASRSLVPLLAAVAEAASRVTASWAVPQAANWNNLRAALTDLEAWDSGGAPE